MFSPCSEDKKCTSYPRGLTHNATETHLPFSILTATVTASLGLSLSMPRASAITTWPKQPSPRGLPRVNLQPQKEKQEGKIDRKLISCRKGDKCMRLTHPQCCSKQVRVWERDLMKPGTEPACQPHPIGFGFFSLDCYV